MSLLTAPLPIPQLVSTILSPPKSVSTVVPDMQTANQIATVISDIKAKYLQKAIQPNGIHKRGTSEQSVAASKQEESKTLSNAAKKSTKGRKQKTLPSKELKQAKPKDLPIQQAPSKLKVKREEDISSSSISSASDNNDNALRFSQSVKVIAQPVADILKMDQKDLCEDEEIEEDSV